MLSKPSSSITTTTTTTTTKQTKRNTHIMQFSSLALIAAALLFLPTASSSSASTMPVYTCFNRPPDPACIATYSTAMSEWSKQFENDASALFDACTAMVGGRWNAALGGLTTLQPMPTTSNLPPSCAVAEGFCVPTGTPDGGNVYCCEPLRCIGGVCKENNKQTKNSKK